MVSNKTVWLITGCSTGFGRELARLLLRRGYKVVVTARNLATLGVCRSQPFESW